MEYHFVALIFSPVYITYFTRLMLNSCNIILFIIITYSEVTAV